MKHPILPATIITALIILLSEVFFGAVSFLQDPSRRADHYSHFVQSRNLMVVRICEMPTQGKNSIKTVADVLEISDSNQKIYKVQGKILLHFANGPSAADIRYGDKLLIESSPDLPQTAINPHQFDYRKHLLRKRILYTDYLTPPHYRILSHDNSSFYSRLMRLRETTIHTIQSSPLHPSQQGIVEALILGWKQDLDEETQSSFRKAGITHLLCLSGLHVGILVFLVSACLSFISNKRKGRIIKGCISLTAIWLFVLFTGMAPATTRAAIMFSIIILGKIISRQPSTLNSIAASALIMLLCRPALLFDVGFQLSYTSVIGIILLVPPLERLITFPNTRNRLANIALLFLKRIWQLICVGIVAQISTVPLTLYYFHQFPPYFLVANVSVIFFAGLLVASAIIMMLLVWCPWAFSAIWTIVSAELSVIEWITNTVASWPHSMIENIYFDDTMLIVSYILIFLAVSAFLSRRLKLVIPSVASAVLLALYSLHVEYTTAKQKDICFYNVDKRAAFELFVGHKSYLICDSVIANNPAKIDFQTSNNLIWHKTKERIVIRLDSSYNDDYIYLKNRYVGFDTTTIRIIDRSNCRLQNPPSVNVNYLYFAERIHCPVDSVLNRYHPDSAVFAYNWKK